jgi:hypothetical protein
MENHSSFWRMESELWKPIVPFEVLKPEEEIDFVKGYE